MQITFKDLADSNCKGVTDYCRLLVSENLRDYSSETIEVYRGDMLCLIVKDIYQAAKIQVNGDCFIPYREKGPRKALGRLRRGSTCV